MQFQLDDDAPASCTLFRIEPFLSRLCAACDSDTARLTDLGGLGSACPALPSARKSQVGPLSAWDLRSSHSIVSDNVSTIISSTHIRTSILVARSRSDRLHLNPPSQANDFCNDLLTNPAIPLNLFSLSLCKHTHPQHITSHFTPLPAAALHKPIYSLVHPRRRYRRSNFPRDTVSPFSEFRPSHTRSDPLDPYLFLILCPCILGIIQRRASTSPPSPPHAHTIFGPCLSLQLTTTPLIIIIDMEDQLFSPNAAAHLFDLPLSSGGPIGFSPSIDMTSSLPHSFGDALEAPAFMLEVQRKRADTTATLKPAFEFADDFGLDGVNVPTDIPQRPRAIQRLSLTSSVASSAASTASEYDYSGFESEDHSNVASPAADDACAASWSEASFNAFDGAESIQTAFNRIGFSSPNGASKDGTIKASTFNAAAAFSFHDFIEDADQGGQRLPLSASVDSMSACDNTAANLVTPQMPVSPLGYSQASSEYGHGYGHMRCSGSESSLGLFGGAEASGLPMAAPMQPYPANSFFGNAGPYPMVFSQSAPDNSCFHPHGSPCPSSPSSARSSSPFPSFGMAGAMPSVLASPPSRQIQIQHIPAPAPGLSMLPKGMSLYNHFAHLANPYAGLITKRSRGRRVPNKPEEMNNLGKSGKVYTCKVPGCGKCFKRSEHLKRHVRSIHTDDKPYLCPYPACNKRFSRHDNLNQHARVHTTMSGDGDVAVGGEGYDASSVYPMSHLGAPMVLTAAPQGGVTIASGPSLQIKQE